MAGSPEHRAAVRSVGLEEHDGAARGAVGCKVMLEKPRNKHGKTRPFVWP